MDVDLEKQAENLVTELSLELLWVALLRNSTDPIGSVRQIGADATAMLKRQAEEKPLARVLYNAMAEHADRHWKSIEERLRHNLR